MTINLDQYTNTLNVTDTATNADLNVTTKGTGGARFNVGNGAKYTYLSSEAANNFQLVGAANTANLGIYATGGGSIRFYTATGLLEEQLRIPQTASAVNFVQVTGAATSASPTITSQGSDTNINLSLSPKGAAVVAVSSELRVATAAVNFFQMYGSGSGSGPVFASIGSDTNIDLTLTPKGTGNVRFGTLTATADTAISGYITIKDSGGTTRKLAVIT